MDILLENDARAVAVLAIVHNNPHISTGQIEKELGIPQKQFQEF